MRSRDPHRAPWPSAIEQYKAEQGFDAALKTTHLTNAFERAQEQLTHLADETSGETRVRVLMAIRCIADASEQFQTEREPDDHD